MDDTRAHLAALLLAQPTPEAVEWVCSGLRRWLLSGTRSGIDAYGQPTRAHQPSLARYLSLPATPERARIALRDMYLLELARTVAADIGPEPWPLACEIARLVHDFEGRKWPCWWHLSDPPGYASETERLLWHARRMAGARLPSTARRYRQLLDGQ